MNAIIKAVWFDFTSSDNTEEPSPEEQQKIIDSVIGKAYELDEDYIHNDIADAISDDTGWCVLDVEYYLTAGQQAYTFYVDQQCTIWYRTRFSIMADSQEHANALAQKLFEDGGIDGIEQKLQTSNTETEQLWDTVESRGIEELFTNDGDHIASLNL